MLKILQIAQVAKFFIVIDDSRCANNVTRYNLIHHISLIFVDGFRRMNPLVLCYVYSLCSIKGSDALVELVEVREKNIISPFERPHGMLQMTIFPFIIGVETRHEIGVVAYVLQCGIVGWETATVILPNNFKSVGKL